MELRAGLFERLKTRLFYGWVVLAVATAGLFASGPGQSHTFSVFIGPISQDLGISSTSIASAYAFATLVAAFGLPMMGRLVDRLGSRFVLIGVVSLLGVACIGFGAAAGLISLSLGFMCLRFLGQGSMMLGSTNMVAQWFSAKRGFAMSILMLGFAASIAVHPSLAQELIERVGWREAWVWLGVVTWALMLPLLLLLAQDKPEPLGLKPDGAGPSPDDGSGKPPAVAGMPLSSAIRTPAFYIIAAGLFTPAMLITSLFFFQVSVFEAHGLDRSLAAAMFGVSALAMALAMPAVGWVLDRSDAKFIFSASLVLLAGSLGGISFVSGPLSAGAYAICFGVNTAANMTFFGYMWAHYFGRRHLGAIQGAGQTIGVVGASVGPLPLGIAFDQWGSYDGALRLLALLPLACAVIALFLKAPDLSPARAEEV